MCDAKERLLLREAAGVAAEARDVKGAGPEHVCPFPPRVRPPPSSIPTLSALFRQMGFSALSPVPPGGTTRTDLLSGFARGPVRTSR